MNTFFSEQLKGNYDYGYDKMKTAEDFRLVLLGGRALPTAIDDGQLTDIRVADSNTVEMSIKLKMPREWAGANFAASRQIKDTRLSCYSVMTQAAFKAGLTLVTRYYFSDSTVAAASTIVSAAECQALKGVKGGP